MFPRPHARHSQIAYVTNDLDRALAVWRDDYGVPAFYVFTNDAPGLESSHPFRLRIALANVAGTEIELIEPLGDTAPLHAEPLPADGGFAIRFHHTAQRIAGTLADFAAHMASLDQVRHPVVWSGRMGDVMRFAYTDERRTLGHYVEHVWFDADFLPAHGRRHPDLAGPVVSGALTMPAATLNFRDLGGLPAGDSHIRHGLLFRSEGPRNFAPGHQAALADIGFRTIIDLRSAGERAAVPHAWHGPACRWLGLDVNADLRVFGNEGRERLLRGPAPDIAIATMVETYREIVGALRPHWPAIAGVLLAGEVPVLLNCTAGKDRTGVAIALLLELAGVPRDAIMADYLRSAVFGENLERDGQVEPGFMASFGFMPSPAQIQALIGVRPDYLEAAWDEIARGWAHVPDYFAASGLDHAMQRRIAVMLVDGVAPGLNKETG